MKLVKVISMDQMLGHDGGDARRDRQDGHDAPALIVVGVMDANRHARRIVSDGPDRPPGDAEMAAVTRLAGAHVCSSSSNVRPSRQGVARHCLAWAGWRAV